MQTKLVLQVIINNEIFYVQNVSDWELSKNLYTADNFRYDAHHELDFSLKRVKEKYPTSKSYFIHVTRSDVKDNWSL